jgi:hypothetical protein
MFAEHFRQSRFPRADVSRYRYVFWFFCFCHINESTKYEV